MEKRGTAKHAIFDSMTRSIPFESSMSKATNIQTEFGRPTYVKAFDRTRLSIILQHNAYVVDILQKNCGS